MRCLDARTHTLPVTALIAAVLAFGCRAQPPISGAPAGGDEQAALTTGDHSVRRGQSIPGQAELDVIAAARKLAHDLSLLLRDTGDDRPIDIALGEFHNRTSLPAPSFRPIQRRLIGELNAAGPMHSLRFHGDESAAAMYLLTADVYDFKARSGRVFLIDYELRRVAVPAAPAADSDGNPPVIWARRYWVAAP
jgi:hypothetical protein